MCTSDAFPSVAYRTIVATILTTGASSIINASDFVSCLTLFTIFLINCSFCVDRENSFEFRKCFGNFSRKSLVRFEYFIKIIDANDIKFVRNIFLRCNERKRIASLYIVRIDDTNFENIRLLCRSVQICSERRILREYIRALQMELERHQAFEWEYLKILHASGRMIFDAYPAFN
jgi:hypothetical protein